ncbi:MAG: hypothetical protein AMXMBFR46_24630 [Acidimicrobiia bacterium]
MTDSTSAAPADSPTTAPRERAPAARDMDRALGDGGMALLGLLGVSFDAYGTGWAEAAWAPTELACNPAGTVHGGVYGVVHDAAMNFATNSALSRGDRATTLDVQYQTIRPAVAGDRLRVRGEVTRCTRQVAYVESAVRDPDDQLVSRATATFILRRREGA